MLRNGTTVWWSRGDDCICHLAASNSSSSDSNSSDFMWFKRARTERQRHDALISCTLTTSSISIIAIVRYHCSVSFVSWFAARWEFSAQFLRSIYAFSQPACPVQGTHIHLFIHCRVAHFHIDADCIINLNDWDRRMVSWQFSRNGAIFAAPKTEKLASPKVKSATARYQKRREQKNERLPFDLCKN